MPFKACPHIENCCGCIPDLRTASAIIAVLALVTNPILSWLMIRHTYAMRVSCYLTSTQRVDVVDLNINNIVSFGFGVNAALGASCLSTEIKQEVESKEPPLYSVIVQGLGWVVMAGDTIFFITSFVFLLRIYKNPTRRVIVAFMVSAIIAMVLSTLYGFLYVGVCAARGKGVALCELALAVFDFILWAYFIMVVNTFSKALTTGT